MTRRARGKRSRRTEGLAETRLAHALDLEFYQLERKLFNAVCYANPVNHMFNLAATRHSPKPDCWKSASIQRTLLLHYRYRWIHSVSANQIARRSGAKPTLSPIENNQAQVQAHRLNFLRRTEAPQFARDFYASSPCRSINSVPG